MSHMIKLLLFLLGTVAYGRPGQRHPDAPRRADGRADGRPAVLEPGAGSGRAAPRSGGDGADPAGLTGGDPGRPSRPGRRHRVPRWLKVSCAVAVAAWVFRRAVAALTVTALSTVLHVVGISAHLPRISFAWPWQTAGAATATITNTDVGPWVLQKIEGISKPALGQANFNFLFTHKVSKNIGPLPCWYASTFYAVGHASATVTLNPGPAWWAPAAGHYRLQVLSRPAGAKPGHVSVTMVLPQPRLPQTVHDITIDNIPSRPIDTQHSWTYPGLGCGAVLRPQFAPAVLYPQAQQIAFYKATHLAGVTRPLIGSAEHEAAQTIRGR